MFHLYIPHSEFDSPDLFQDSCATCLQSLGPYCCDARVHDAIVTRFSKVMNYWYYFLIKTRHVTLLQEALCIHVTKERVVGLFSTLRSLKGETQLALLAFLADFNCTLDKCGVDEVEAVRVLDFLLSDGAEDL